MDIAVAIAVTAALVEVVKSLNYVPSRFIPLISLVIGCIIGFLAPFDLMTSLTIGLSASGFYSAQKTLRGM